jgi:hypothetical protein
MLQVSRMGACDQTNCLAHRSSYCPASSARKRCIDARGLCLRVHVRAHAHCLLGSCGDAASIDVNGVDLHTNTTRETIGACRRKREKRENRIGGGKEEFRVGSEPGFFFPKEQQKKKNELGLPPPPPFPTDTHKKLSANEHNHGTSCMTKIQIRSLSLLPCLLFVCKQTTIGTSRVTMQHARAFICGLLSHSLLLFSSLDHCGIQPSTSDVCDCSRRLL